MMHKAKKKMFQQTRQLWRSNTWTKADIIGKRKNSIIFLMCCAAHNIENGYTYT